MAANPWAWQDQAACAEVDVNLFFSDERNSFSDRAAGVVIDVYCTPCPVRVTCLRAALYGREQGVWGGTTDADRRKLLRGEARTKCPVCAAPEPERIDQGAGQVCRSCGHSWRTLPQAGRGFLRAKEAV